MALILDKVKTFSGFPQERRPANDQKPALSEVLIPFGDAVLRSFTATTGKQASPFERCKSV
ncbi:MAG: hypothetical protein J5846_08685 [Desulfovibrio sp.]|nr:hypothetical protein [Desulfovibrio sp.]